MLRVCDTGRRERYGSRDPNGCGCGDGGGGRVFGGAALGGMIGSVGGAALGGTIGSVTGEGKEEGGNAGERNARGGCIVERLRGEERNTPPRSLYYLPRSCAHTQRRAVTARG